MRFTKKELEAIRDALAYSKSFLVVDEQLEGKVSDALTTMDGGPYRTLATDSDLDWVNDDLDELVDKMIVSKEERLAAMVHLEGSLTQQNDALKARLSQLKPLVVLQDENERLKLELAAHGPPEALEEIEILKRDLASIEGERDVLLRQVHALKDALRSERVSRMAAEDRRVPMVDVDLPALPAKPRACLHMFDYRECNICRNLLPPADGP